MQLTLDELVYMKTVLARTSSYTIARAEQIDLPAVKHQQLQQKIDDEIFKRKGEFDYGCWKDRDDLLNAIRHENRLMNKKFKFEKPHNIKNRKKDEG